MIVIHITTARSRGFLSELSSLLNVTRRFWLLGAEREREREETIRTLHDATRIAKKKKIQENAKDNTTFSRVYTGCAG